MLASSTPDALWSAPSARLLRPSAVSCVDVSRGRLLNRCSLSVPVGMRLLVVAEMRNRPIRYFPLFWKFCTRLKVNIEPPS